MKTNAIFQKIIQAFSLDIPYVQTLLNVSGIELGEQQIAKLLKREGEGGFKSMPDYVLAIFLNNFINERRGRTADGEESINKRQKLSNNDVLKKLRVAFNLHEKDVRDVLSLATIELTKSDLSALFRKSGNSHFKACDDELLIDFIEALGQWLQQKQNAEH